MKRTTRLLLRSFIGPFVITFMVALFFLDMQFLWVYADEMIGKGLSVFVVLELLSTLLPGWSTSRSHWPFS